MLGDTDRQRSMDLDVPPLQESDGSEDNPVFDTEPQAKPSAAAEEQVEFKCTRDFMKFRGPILASSSEWAGLAMLVPVLTMFVLERGESVEWVGLTLTVQCEPLSHRLRSEHCASESVHSPDAADL